MTQEHFDTIKQFEFSIPISLLAMEYLTKSGYSKCTGDYSPNQKYYWVNPFTQKFYPMSRPATVNLTVEEIIPQPQKQLKLKIEK